MTPSEGITYFGRESNIVATTLQETLGVIRKLKNNRAPEEDSVTSELIKYGGRKLWKRIRKFN
jgi:cobyric acid synthase